MRLFAIVFAALLAFSVPPSQAQNPDRARAEELAQAWMEGAAHLWVQVLQIGVASAADVQVFQLDRGEARRAEQVERLFASREQLLARTAAMRRVIAAYPDPPDLARAYGSAQLSMDELRRAQENLNAIRPRQLAVLDQIDAAAIASEEMQQQIFRGEMSVAAAGRASVMMRLRPMATVTTELVRGTSLYFPEGSPPQLVLLASVLNNQFEDVRAPLFVAILRGHPADAEAARREFAEVARGARNLAAEMRVAANTPLARVDNAEQQRDMARMQPFMPEAAAIIERYAEQVDTYAAGLEGITAAQVLERGDQDGPVLPDLMAEFTESAATPR